jgi:hypothetical protein
MLPPSSKRKWWERGRVHTYPTFDNKLNCAIELYYTHRDDGNLAAPVNVIYSCSSNCSYHRQSELAVQL